MRSAYYLVHLSHGRWQDGAIRAPTCIPPAPPRRQHGSASFIEEPLNLVPSALKGSCMHSAEGSPTDLPISACSGSDTHSRPLSHRPPNATERATCGPLSVLLGQTMAPSMISCAFPRNESRRNHRRGKIFALLESGKSPASAPIGVLVKLLLWVPDLPMYTEGPQNTPLGCHCESPASGCCKATKRFHDKSSEGALKPSP